MNRRVHLATLVLACLLATGCQPQAEHTRDEPAARPGGIAQQGGSPPEVQSTSAIPPPAPAQRVSDAWRLFGNPQDPKAPRTEWVGLNAADELIVGGESLLDVPVWMQLSDVSEVIVRQPSRRAAPGSTVVLATVTRSKFTTWPKAGVSLPFPATDVTKYVNAWAVGTVHERTSADSEIRSWLAQRLGNRLVNVSVEREGHVLVTATVRAGALSEQERILEAAVLQAGLSTLTDTQTLVVDYQGVNATRRIRVPGLSEWAKHGADVALLRNCVEVDGLDGQDCPVGGQTVPEGFIHLLAARAAIESFLPRGAETTIVDAGFRRVVIEGKSPGDTPREQLLSTYGDAVEKIFSAAPDAFEVELLLTQGNYVEYFLFNRNQWSVRHFLVQDMGVAVPAEALVMTANEYQRYELSPP